MRELIDKLERAAAGSREMDGAVWYAVFEPDVNHGCLHVEQTEQGPREVLTCELGSKWADDVGPYTTSLDAALALAERVLPGRQWRVARDDGFAPILCYRAWVATREEVLANPLRSVGAPTPALALCIAILRASNPVEREHAQPTPQQEER